MSLDRVQSIIRHVSKQNDYYSVTLCTFHFNKPCFTLFNNFNEQRFHCLFANQSSQWRSYSITKSCDIPEHFYDMINLNKILGTKYVLQFAGHFRESSGYTVGMFRQTIDLYPPTIIDRRTFKKTLFTMIILFIAICHRLGGITPDLKQCSFVFTKEHPVLCDIGRLNAEKKELKFKRKKWKKFLCRKTTRDVIRMLKHIYGKYFQKKKPGKKCILNDGEQGEGFDDETHGLICGSKQITLSNVLNKYKHLNPDFNNLITEWLHLLEDDD